jgi:hypothetical protein
MQRQCRVAAIAVVLLVSSACAEKQKVERARGKPNGAGVVLVDPVAKLTSGTTCSDTVVADVAARSKDAAKTALTRAGFRITEDESAPFAASISVEIGYCSDAGIVNGATNLELAKKTSSTASSIWRGDATGDLAKSETAASTMAELVDVMLDDPNVIGVLNGGGGQ